MHLNLKLKIEKNIFFQIDSYFIKIKGKDSLTLSLIFSKLFQGSSRNIKLLFNSINLSVEQGIGLVCKSHIQISFARSSTTGSVGCQQTQKV